MLDRFLTPLLAEVIAIEPVTTVTDTETEYRLSVAVYACFHEISITTSNYTTTKQFTTTSTVQTTMVTVVTTEGESKFLNKKIYVCPAMSTYS